MKNTHNWNIFSRSHATSCTYKMKLIITFPIPRDVDEDDWLLNARSVYGLLGLSTRGDADGAWRLSPNPNLSRD